MLELREAYDHNKGTNAAPVEIRDIVVDSDKRLRSFRKLAQVERTITGRNGKVRGAASYKPSGMTNPAAQSNIVALSTRDQSPGENCVTTKFTRG